jgi:hypothetical protein
VRVCGQARVDRASSRDPWDDKVGVTAEAGGGP